jgi:serine O-acetyltransferase
MTFREYKCLIISDLYRITGKVSWTSFLRQAMFGEGFQYVLWMRTCRYTRQASWPLFVVHSLARLMLRRQRYKLGISIPFMTEIGKGFFIGHFGGIVVNERVTIGKNCNLSAGVIIGQVNRGRNKGNPTIGDNVFIGPGAKIIGAISIGDNVAVGANCVVTKDVPANAVVVGVPAKVISFEGSRDYVNKTV